MRIYGLRPTCVYKSWVDHKQPGWLEIDMVATHNGFSPTLFQPSFKLKRSLREEGWIKRHHHSPLTPLQQLLRTGVLSDKEGQGLRELRKKCDPLALLVLLIRGQRASAMAGDLRSFLKGLQALWRQSRPYRKGPSRGRVAAVAWIHLRPMLIPSPNGWRQKRMWVASSFCAD